MQIFQTNSGLGYRQFAYLILIDKEKKLYLCIDLVNVPSDDDMYVIGKVTTDEGDLFADPSDYKIEESPLFNTFLFQHFIKTFSK